MKIFPLFPTLSFRVSSKFWKTLLIASTLLFLLLTSKLYRDQAFSFHFVDEEESIVIAKFMLGGEKLYTDIFSNHQPLTYFFSEGVQKATHPSNLLLLIKRHREVMIIWSIIWSIFLIWRFGLPLVYFVVIYELSKGFLLGNLFLAESLAVYPLVYLVSVLSDCKLGIRLECKINPGWEIFLISLSFFTVWFLLIPLWPLLILLAVLLFLTKFKKLKNLLIFFTCQLIGILILFHFISWGDYFRDSIYANLSYFIPVAPSDHMPKSLWEAFLAPSLTFFSGINSATLWIERALSLIIILNVFLLIRRKEYKYGVFLVAILGLSDLRYYMPGSEIYEGFHLLPWFSLLVLLSGVSFNYMFQVLGINNKGKLLNLKSTLVVLIVLSITVAFRQTTIFKRVDQQRDFYVNYSTQYSIGEAARVMKSPDDNLFVVPDEWLIYWQSGVKHPIQTLGYYAWMSNYPYLNNMVQGMFINHPPTFLYCNCVGSGVEKYFNKYKELKKDGGATHLYVLPAKLNSLTWDQINLLNGNGYQIQ